MSNVVDLLALMEQSVQLQAEIAANGGKLTREIVLRGIPLYEQMERITVTPEIKLSIKARLAALRQAARELSGENNVIDFDLYKKGRKK